ncbi:putative leucine-rich repeat-containing protein DDB_G0290503 isoform X2 [Dreissena polymorpha]|uniref:putative leucine-rich repeat-containing protein DDB_G0290503 isoform X2 n=1 Tax=Dreissena polymorpha TaxID=45954 RepID=UPI0022650631|nr:putative leucine-rich repeat-containing protein DDB_G0290503 isoform X2 [Dreissena polymorpha]
MYIWAKSTQHEKIIELLLMLPKRGPRAFQVFVEAVRKHSSFLAEKLEHDYEKEFKIMTEEMAKSAGLGNQEHKEQQKPVENNPSDDKSELKLNIPETPMNVEILIEKSFAKQPTRDQLTERRHSLSISTTNHAMTSSIVQQNLNTLYTKLKAKMHMSSAREHSFATPEPATFKMVDKLVEDVFHALDEYEMTFAQCHALLGGKDRNYPIVSHIINLQKAKRELEQELKAKDLQKNKYADHISKLENRCRNQATEVNHLNEEVNKLKEEITKLQAINSEREEKQKIIDELRKMVMEADTSKKNKLRSSYLALHYDSNSSEIKQLRDEVKRLQLENENLKTENLMLKKSDNLKKLAKLREDQTHIKLELPLAQLANHDDEKDSVNSSVRNKHESAVSPTHGVLRGAGAKTIEMERQSFLYQGQERSFMRASADNISSERIVEAVKPYRSRPIDKEKERETREKEKELEFKFSNNGQNVSLGSKRSSSKDRSSKRVTFVGDISKNNDSEESPSAHFGTLHAQEAEKILANGPGPTLPNGNGKIPVVNYKQDKGGMSRGRSRQTALKSKAASKRSASLTNLASREMLKMSSQLIQKSKNLRQPLGN